MRGSAARWGWLVVLAPLLLFFRVGSFEFLDPWDDGVNLLRNPGMNPPSLRAIGSFWTESYAGLYAPVSYTFWSLEALLFGLDPRAFHLVNLGLHVLVGWLVFRWLLGLVGDARAAGLGALLFALHPLAVGTHAWVTETRGLLAAAFGFGALILAGSGRDGTRRLGPATLCLVLALLSKPTAAAIPLMAVALERFCGHASWRGALRTYAPWFVLAALVVVLSKSLQPDDAVGAVATLAQRPLIAADALAFYAGKSLVPVGLAADHARLPAAVLAGAGAWLALLGLVALVVLVHLRPAHARWRAPLWVWIAALLPSLGFVPFLYQQHSTVADRYAYLALGGMALGAAVWIQGPGRRIATVVTVAAVASCAWLAHLQVDHWRNARALFEHSVAVAPDSAIARTNLATALHVAGDFEGAEEHYRESLRLRTDAPRTHLGLGLLLQARGDLGGARAAFESAVRLEPDLAPAHYSLGLALLQGGELEDARPWFERAVELDPDYVAAHTNLGFIHAQAGRVELATLHYERALALDPDFGPASEGLRELRRP